jgi:hypothetical protein
MKNFFKTYLDLVLMVSALIMAGLLLWLFVDVSTDIAVSFSQAVSAGRQGAGGNTAFRIEEAKQLNLRGLSEKKVEVVAPSQPAELPTTTTLEQIAPPLPQ